MSIRSPFPGMDPWLEQHWGDIHHTIITYARDQLQPKLPGTDVLLELQPLMDQAYRNGGYDDLDYRVATRATARSRGRGMGQ